MRTLREGTAIKVITTDGRVRHTIVTTVTDQDTIEGRIGLVGNSASVAATRETGTKTRGTQFEE